MVSYTSHRMLSGRQAEERRLTEQLILYWNQLRQHRKFPTIKEIDATTLGEAWQDCMLVQMLPQHTERHHVLYTGKHLEALIGREEMRTADGTSVFDHILTQCHNVAGNLRPVVDECEYAEPQGKQMKCRSIFLPFGEDGQTVDHVFGGMRFKMVE